MFCLKLVFWGSINWNLLDLQFFLKEFKHIFTVSYKFFLSKRFKSNIAFIYQRKDNSPVAPVLADRYSIVPPYMYVEGGVHCPCVVC